MSDQDDAPPETTEGGEIDMVELMGGRIRSFAARPISNPDMERLLELMLREQAQVEAEIFPTVFDLKQRLLNPEWAVEIASPNALGRLHGVSGVKLIQDVFALPTDQQADAALRAASVLALLTDGLTARAVLKIFGFQYRFVQHKGQARRIIAPT